MVDNYSGRKAPVRPYGRAQGERGEEGAYRYHDFSESRRRRTVRRVSAREDRRMGHTVRIRRLVLELEYRGRNQ